MVAVCIVLNEEEYIEYALRSVYDFVDYIIVIEGAVTLCMNFANADGSSTDSTVDIIQSIPDPKDKIILEQGIWESKIAQRQRYLDIILQQNLAPDYILQVDGDEIYPYATLVEIQRIIKKGKTDLISTPFYHFWTSFQWRATGSIWSAPQLRCIRYRENLKYTRSHIYPNYGNSDLLSQTNKRYKHQVTKNPIFHYSYVKPHYKIMQKLQFYRNRDGHRLNITDNWTTWKPGQITSCTHTAVNSSAELYEEGHPEVMINHPYRYLDDIRRIK